MYLLKETDKEIFQEPESEDLLDIKAKILQ